MSKLAVATVRFLGDVADAHFGIIAGPGDPDRTIGLDDANTLVARNPGRVTIVEIKEEIKEEDPVFTFPPLPEAPSLTPPPPPPLPEAPSLMPPPRKRKDELGDMSQIKEKL